MWIIKRHELLCFLQWTIFVLLITPYGRTLEQRYSLAWLLYLVDRLKSVQVFLSKKKSFLWTVMFPPLSPFICHFNVIIIVSVNGISSKDIKVFSRFTQYKVSSPVCIFSGNAHTNWVSCSAVKSYFRDIEKNYITLSMILSFHQANLSWWLKILIKLKVSSITTFGSIWIYKN